MGDWVATWDRCFVEGCFTYDLAVQIVGTLGALSVALLLFLLTQWSQESQSVKDRKAQDSRFDTQMKQERDHFEAQMKQQQAHLEQQFAYLRLQIDGATEERKEQRERWFSERRIHALESEHERVLQHLKTANAVRVELLRLFEKNNANDLGQLQTSYLDGLTGAYSVLPAGVYYIRAAHERAQMMTIPGAVTPHTRDLFGSALDSAIITLSNLEQALAEQEQLLMASIREEVGLRVELAPERHAFDEMFRRHSEASEE